MVKKILFTLLSILLCLSLASCKDDSLPLPEVEDGMRGQLGIDKNINEKTIDKYLDRDDSVYRDMRMLSDEANYEAIGGDSYLSGYVKGFEIVPYPYLCNVVGLPVEVGQSYSGNTLFAVDENGNYTANYKESEYIINKLFPTDKNIFLMCGGGGYAGMTKQLLVSLGYNPDKIYNVGGYWYYEGDNKIETTYEVDGTVFHDFIDVPYHEIDFSSLHRIGEENNQSNNNNPQESSFIEIYSTVELNRILEEENDMALFLYLPGCSSCANFEPVVKEFTEKNNIKMYTADLSTILNEESVISGKILYSPSMAIFKDKELIAYLDARSNDDMIYYENAENLLDWFNQHIDLSLLEDCDGACLIEG